MFNHILVPVDFSDDNRHSLTIALELARLSQGQVTLLHIIEMIAETTLQGELREFYAKLEQQAREKFDALLAEFMNSQAPLTSEIAYGERVQEILSYVEQNQIDLIVMSSHRIDPANPTVGWGTLSHKIGILAPCPVMLVK